jgi:xylan 1,4-beta-xylosidase
VKGEAKLQHFRIDEAHSNAFSAWKRLGSPQRPTPEQYEQLERAGRLQEMEGAPTVPVQSRQATIKFSLPRQAVSLLQLTW